MSCGTFSFLCFGSIIAIANLVGCQRAQPTSAVPAGGAAVAIQQTAREIPTARHDDTAEPAAPEQDASGAGDSEEPVATPIERQPEAPAPLTIAEKIQRRYDLQQRIREKMTAARSQLTVREQELAKQIAFHGQVFGLLGQDIANDRFNLANRGLVMPWELSARRNLLTHGRRALERPVSEASLGVAAAIGNEQLRSVKEQIGSLEREQYCSIAARVWSELSAGDRAACEEYLPEFALEASGARAEEEKQLSTALASEPQSAKHREARGRLRIARGELRQAAEDLAACIESNPENIGEVRLLYGELMLELGNQNTALSQFSAVAGLKSPLAAEGWARRGLMAFQDNELKYAQDNLDRALQADANCATAYYLQGRINARRNRLDYTITAFQSAVRCAPQNAAYQFELAEFFQIAKQSAEALQAFSRAAELEPYWWRPYFAMGRAKLLQKDVAGALAEFNLAANLAPDEPTIFEGRAIVHTSLGNEAEAAADRQRLRDLRPRR
jgi:Tfp pilus assembly protein PilF